MSAEFDLFSFSTSWNCGRTHDGSTMMEEIKALGFNKAELNYNVTEDQMRGILPFIERNQMSISSLHNVFPAIDDPDYDTDSLFLGYDVPEKRQKSIELTKRTVDYAARLGAGAVVIHPGEVCFSGKPNYDEILKRLYEQGKKDTDEYVQQYNEMITHREKHSMKYTTLIKESLAEVAEYIQKKNYKVVLGIESRWRCHQIPNFKEMHYLLDELEGLPVYFWYDIGHGMMMSALGMFDHVQETYNIRDKIIGMHIHDLIGVDDHLVPYIHSENLDAYIDIIKDVPFRVLELGGRCTPADIRKGVEILNEKVMKAMCLKG